MMPREFIRCPVCVRACLTAEVAPRFKATRKRDALLFYVCLTCAHRYDSAATPEKLAMQNRAVCSIKGNRPPGHDWAVTTYIALCLNGGDFELAIENGLHGMDRRTYDRLQSSEDFDA